MTRRARLLVACLIGLGTAVGLAGPAQAAIVSPTPARSWGVNGRVLASVVVGNQVIVGGTFTAAVSPSGATVPRAHLAAFDATTGELVTGFTADANYTVRALTQWNGTVYAGGQFTRINGTTRNRVAAFAPGTGALVSTFAPSVTGGQVYALDARAGRLFLGGDFTAVSGVARTRVAAVDAATGALDPSFAPAPDNRVNAIRSTGDGATVYLGGKFTSVSGVARAGLARVDAATGAVSAVAFQYAPAIVLGLDLTPDGAGLLVAGGGTNNSGAVWNTSTGKRTWTLRTDGDVQAIHYFDGDAYFGFHDGYQGLTTTKLLKVNATNGAQDTSFVPSFTGFWGVFTISDGAGYLVAGGGFGRVNGVVANNWARFPVTG
jgi:Domain of unknown function (DUF5122) beta-propeller